MLTVSVIYSMDNFTLCSLAKWHLCEIWSMLLWKYLIQKEAKQNVQLFQTPGKIFTLFLVEMWFISHSYTNWGGLRKNWSPEVCLAQTTWPCAFCVSMAGEIFTATEISLWPNTYKLSSLFKTNLWLYKTKFVFFFLKLECVWRSQGHFISVLQISNKMSKGKTDCSNTLSESCLGK